MRGKGSKADSRCDLCHGSGWYRPMSCARAILPPIEVRETVGSRYARRPIPDAGSSRPRDRRRLYNNLTWACGLRLACVRALGQQQDVMRNALIALLLASTLGACAAQKAPEAAVPSPPPPVKWYKEGASAEEFKRTRAQCTMNASTAGTMADPPSVFRSCMRSQGWAQK